MLDRQSRKQAIRESFFIGFVVFIVFGIPFLVFSKTQDTPLEKTFYISENGVSFNIVDSQKNGKDYQFLIQGFDTATGDQYGFGQGGVVDIETVHIKNMPELVPDGTFSEIEHPNKEGEKLFIPNYKYDPQEAQKIILSEFIKSKGAKGSQNIEEGRIGTTTYIFYASSEGDIYSTSTVDFQTVHDATTGYKRDTASQYNSYIQTDKQGVGGSWQLARGYANFDTSSLSGSTITSSTLELESHADAGSGSGIFFGLYGSTAGEPITGSDFDAFLSTEYASSIPIASWGASGVRNAFNFNANGKAGISTIGYTKLAFREQTYDVGNTSPPSSGYYYFGWKDSGTAGTVDDPTLIVEATATPPPSGGGYSISEISLYVQAVILAILFLIVCFFFFRVIVIPR